MDEIKVLAKPNVNDSESSRLLKEVLQSTARLQREMAVEMGSKTPKARDLIDVEDKQQVGHGIGMAKKGLELLSQEEAPAAPVASFRDKLERIERGHVQLCENCAAGPAHEMSPILSLGKLTQAHS